MDRLAYTTLASVTERRLLREQLNNELANVSTVGFKRSFDSAMTAVKAEGDGFDSRIQPFIVQKDAISLEPGSLMATGRNLDVAMNDKAVLGVQGKDGTMAFTRRGDLRVNSQGVLKTAPAIWCWGRAAIRSRFRPASKPTLPKKATSMPVTRRRPVSCRRCWWIA